jgi:hypothetical protein
MHTEKTVRINTLIATKSFRLFLIEQGIEFHDIPRKVTLGQTDLLELRATAQEILRIGMEYHKYIYFKEQHEKQPPTP